MDQYGYSFVRRDRDSGPGGGVLIYFKANLTAYLVTRWNCTHLEAAWLNVTIRSQSFLIGCIYRPPQDSLFFNHFRKKTSGLEGKILFFWVTSIPTC